ncbi:MAG: LptF/LptG family permease [Alphaproteobacteria bacterium]|nr:MAG: LptF/LptG family permease [Alphaproteobacteria bacterium]
MPAFGVLSRYLARHFLFSLVLITVAILALVFTFETAELLRRAAAKPEATLDIVLRISLFKLPETLQRVLPFVILFSAQWALWRLTRSHELVIIRAAGLSVWQFLMPFLALVALSGALYLTLINPLGATMIGEYRRLETRYLNRITTLDISSAGLWLRQTDGDRSLLMHAEAAVQRDPLVLKPLMVLIYDSAGAYLGRLDAAEAVLRPDGWELRDVWRNEKDQALTRQDVVRLPTSLSESTIEDSLAPPTTVSFVAMPGFIRALEALGLPALRHRLEFHGLFAQPLLLLAMVLMAAVFSLRHIRQGGALTQGLMCLAAGATVFAMNSLVLALGGAQTLPVILAAWSIPMAALLATAAALFHLEDG